MLSIHLDFRCPFVFFLFFKKTVKKKLLNLVTKLLSRQQQDELMITAVSESEQDVRHPG